MAVTDQQKLDFLLKKIGYTKTKTGSVVGTGAISGTPKQPFAEAIPSPLIIANGALWNESGSIPTTPPGSDTAQVKVYLAASSGLRMTADSTSSGQRAYIAYSTYGNASSTRLTNWIDTQFGSAYLIKVYKGDPNSGGVALSAAGSGANDGWFFDYSAGVLNFNDTNVPSGVQDDNIYIVGYRYIGLTGAPTPTGGGNFTFNDLVVSRNFQVAGLSTFNGLVDINAGGQANTFKVEDLTDNRIVIAGTGGELEDSANLTFDGSTLGVTGDATFSGNVAIGGTLTYEDVKNIDAVGLITARSGIRVTGGVIEAQAGENKIPSLYAAMGNLPSAGSYHGMFAHVHATGRGYFAHAGNWYELVNKEVNGVVGTGTERYNIGPVDLTTLDVSGISTFAGNVDINADIDVDGHTNLDNVSVAGVSTFSDNLKIIDDKKIIVGNGDGSGNDLEIFHQSSNNYNYIKSPNKGFIIQNAGMNATYVSANYLNLTNANASETYATFNINGISLNYKGQTKFQTATSGINVVGTTTTGQLAVTGVSTFTGNIDANGNIDLAGDLDIDGHTNLDNVSIAGVTSVASLTSGRVVTAGTGGKLQDSNNLTFDGTNLFVSGINVTQPGSGTTSTFGADIVTRNFKATGLSTFVGQSEFDGNVKFDSTITAGGSAGSNGQYLKTTGSGVEWATFPTLRTRQTFTASSGQTTFSFSYTVNFIDVFVNGIKLTDAEFTATNGSTVVLAVGCFVGDIVELVSYNTVSGGGGGGGGGGISNVVEDTTPQLGGNLDLFNKSITGTGNVNITGVITATNFVGDGSGLTNVIGSGSGVVVKDDGNVVGTAGTIDFGQNISVTPISAGIVTVGVTSASLDINKLTVTGITTFVGITTFTNEVSFRPPINGKVNFYGSVEGQRLRWQNNGSNVGLYFNNNVVSYYGNDSRTQISPHGNGGSGDHFRVWQYRPDGKENQLMIDSDFIRINGAHYGSHSSRALARINYDDGASFYHHGNKKFQTSGVGVTITSQLDVTNINASGVTTTTEVRSNALSLKNAAGSATYATFSNGGASVLKWNNTDRLETTTSGVTVTGTVAATSYTGDGSQLTGIGAGSTANVRTSTLEVVGVTTFNTDVDFKGSSGATKILYDASQDALEFADSATLSFGSHPGTGDYQINYVNGGDFAINAMSGGSQDLVIGRYESATQKKHLVSTRAGVIELYHDNTKRLETTATGVVVTGILTATSFVGDGSSLTGISGGVTVQDEGSALSTTATTLNFVGSGVVASGNGATKTITIAGGSSQDVFRTIAVSGQSDVVADSATDTLTLVAGSNMTITTNAGSDTITFASSGGGGGTDVGITTNLSGSFTASAGTPATINTFAYHDNDKVVEYTVYIKNGSDFQSQKLLAMRDGTTIHSTQFAVMFSSSLLVQCDATISSGNILLRATPETGVSGSTTYKIKREVM